MKFNTFPMKIEKSTHPESNNPFLKLTKQDGTSLIISQIMSISYGKKGVDYNFCDKSFTAVKDHETQYELAYKIQKQTSASNSPQIIITATLLSDNTVEVTITDDSGTRFIVPKETLKLSQLKKSDITRNINDFVKFTTDKFTLKIHEFQNPNSAYFRIDDSSLVFADYYLSLDTQVNTNKFLYGFGERVTDFFIVEGIYTTWSRDIPDPIDDGEWPGKNVYGTHPVYFTRSKTGKKLHWGMMNLNANGQDTSIKYTGDLGAQISHYISGQGIFDMYFFLDHPNPESAVKGYHQLIGYSLLPPFYSLGWNQCRYGYRSTSELQEVYDNYTKANFPMDSLWSDIDYMHKYRDFTFDNNGSYAGLDKFVENTLHANGKHYVPIIDAGIAIVKDGTYPSFETGLKKNAFILSGNAGNNNNDDPDILYGDVWPGYAAFPDFTSAATNQWWVDELNEFNNKLKFDGLWLDMNEAANFCSGVCVDKDIVPKDKSVLRKLTYTPGRNTMEDKSLSLDAKHSDGQIELNYHSLFGFMQGVASHKYFVQKNQRPFIISRSTFVGQGKYTSHWLGDNFSDFDYLKYSIPGILSMNIFGINFVGSDICGFIGDTDDNLCQKWTILGAFYPFARNHNAIGNRDQEPYRFSEDIQKNMRNAINWRYAMLRYFYTQLYINSIEGGTFWKPLFFEFPEDPNAYIDVNRNIMLGPSVKFSPMIDEKDAKTQNYIFPFGVWCDIISLL
jgi:alpha-glucosidase (family GH31 glycosyl hydrolase)